jgi:hypothetical protein
MSPRFERYIGIDYSGAEAPTAFLIRVKIDGQYCASAFSVTAVLADRATAR